MFINPVENTPMSSNNAMMDELNEIENSINNSKTIKPIREQEEISESAEEKTPEINITKPSIDDDDDLDFIEEFEDESEDETPINKEESMSEQAIVIPETRITNFKDVLQLIRDCSEKIEDAGFIIDTEEYDLDDMYQIIFKINK